MKLLDKIARKFGYEKGSRISDIIGGGQHQWIYGASQPENYSVYLSSYSNEAWVYICVYLIATTIAGTPWKIVKEKVKSDELVTEDVYDAELYNLLKNVNDADANSTWSSLMEFSVANMELTGNAYWLLDEMIGGTPKSILPLMSDRVTIKQGIGDKLIDGYSYSRKDGQIKTYPAEEIIHLKYANPANYFYGQGGFSAGRMAVETHRGSTESNNNLFRNGSIGLQVFATDQSLSAENFNRLRNQIKDNYSGKENAHKFLILENGLKKQDNGTNGKDLDFINGQKLTREDICGVFGVPPILAGNLDKATYSNYKESEKIFWKSTLLPKMRNISNTITLLAKMFNLEYRFIFDTSNIEALKEDIVLKADTAVKFFNMGIPLNQIIEKLELPFDKVEGGDLGLIPFSLNPIGSTREEVLPPEEGNESNEDKKKKLEEKQMNLWLKFINMTGKYERHYKAIIAKYFGDLERGVLARLKKKANIFSKLQKEIDSNFGITKTVEDDIDDILFDEEKEAKTYSGISMKVMRMALEEAGRRQLRQLGVSGNFDIYDPNVVDWLKKSSGENAKFIMESEREELRKILADGYKEGTPYKDIEAKIMNSFDGYDEKYKAERIARTEINAAANKGRVEAMRDAGVKKKYWLTAGDERVRGSHQIAGEKYAEGIPIDEDFEVGGHSCDSPGNTGDAGEDVNCRCSCEAAE